MKRLIDYSDAELFAMTNEQLLALGYRRISQDESPNGYIWLVPVGVEVASTFRLKCITTDGEHNAAR